MKKIILTAVTLFVISQFVNAQNVGIGTNTPATSALLDVTANNKGLLVPRVTNVQMNAIASPANGLLVYNTDSTAFAYRTGTAWVFLKGNTTASNDWSTKGNAGTNVNTNFIGTIDNANIIFKRNNIRAGLISLDNISLGEQALNPATTGIFNIAFGEKAMTSNTSGNFNTATGYSALKSNTEGFSNTATGLTALLDNTTGYYNTAIGARTLFSNISGHSNVAIGYGALIKNLAGNNNIAVGLEAGRENTGSSNVFLGNNAGYSESGSNKLYIQNSNVGPDQALIYGEFDNKMLSIGGKLGVGTIAPATLLHVKNANTDVNASQLIVESNSGFGSLTTAAIEFRSNFTSSGSGPSGRIKSYYTSNNFTDAKTTFQTVGPGPVFVDAMTLTDGKVGIGTTTPHGELQLPNRLGNRKIILLEDADNDHQFNGLGINAFIMRYQAAALTSSHVFYVGASTTTSTELMRITGNGEVGIGKIPLTSINDSRLQIKQKGFQNGIGLESAENTNHWDFYVGSGTASNFFLYYNGINKGTFDNVTGAYTANSDRRLKKDITPQAPVMNNLLQLQAYQYHYVDNQPTDRFSNGFMAQEVQKIFPDAVVENTMKDGQTRLGINYQYFTVLAIKGLQEQQKEMEEIKAQLKLLKEEMEKLKLK